VQYFAWVVWIKLPVGQARALNVGHCWGVVPLKVLVPRFHVERGPFNPVSTDATVPLHTASTSLRPTILFKEGNVTSVRALLALTIIVVWIGVGTSPLEMNAITLGGFQDVRHKVVLSAWESLDNIPTFAPHVERVDSTAICLDVCGKFPHCKGVRSILEGSAELIRVDGKLQPEIVVFIVVVIVLLGLSQLGGGVVFVGHLVVLRLQVLDSGLGLRWCLSVLAHNVVLIHNASISTVHNGGEPGIAIH
jgi:hypothetical protein